MCKRINKGLSSHLKFEQEVQEDEGETHNKSEKEKKTNFC